MKIHLMSDLHIESHPDSLVAGADGGEDLICLVAGDWANGRTLLKAGFADVTNPHGISILAVHGNHDWYGLDMWIHANALRARAASIGVTILNQNRYEFCGWTILGCTLWSNFALYGLEDATMHAAAAQEAICDFEQIHHGGKLLEPRDIQDFYAEDHAWLEQQLGQTDPLRTIVMTHFGPHPNSVHPFYQHKSHRSLNPYFCNDTGLIERHQPVLWVHGHTHQRLDYTVGRTRVVTNPRGYGGERQAIPFDPCLILNVQTP